MMALLLNSVGAIHPRGTWREYATVPVQLSPFPFRDIQLRKSILYYKNYFYSVYAYSLLYERGACHETCHRQTER